MAISTGGGTEPAWSRGGSFAMIRVGESSAATELRLVLGWADRLEVLTREDRGDAKSVP